MTLYWAASGAMPTTAALASVATGTGTKTHLQIASSSTQKLHVVKWGVSFLTAPAAPVTCELIETGAIGATITQHVAAGIQPYSDAGAPASSVLIATTGQTGYNASAEGSITATRYADLQVIPTGVSQYTWEWSLGREFEVAVSRFLRVRMLTGTTVNAYSWIVWDE